MNLGELIRNMKVGQIAKATFAIEEHWYIIMTAEKQVRYCNDLGEFGEELGDLVCLTYSNLNAEYELIN